MKFVRLVSAQADENRKSRRRVHPEKHGHEVRSWTGDGRATSAPAGCSLSSLGQLSGVSAPTLADKENAETDPTRPRDGTRAPRKLITAVEEHDEHPRLNSSFFPYHSLGFESTRLGPAGSKPGQDDFAAPKRRQMLRCSVRRASVASPMSRQTSTQHNIRIP